jgi:hypothetical protein
MPRGRNLSELSPARLAVAVAVFVVSLGIVAVAQRDIQRRPDSQVRGNRLVWRLVSLNAAGALVYLRWGRTSAAG